MDSNGNKVSLTKKTVSLEKKQKISLTKAVETGLNKVNIGLGWDPVKQGASTSSSAAPAKKGFLSKLFGGGESTPQPRRTANIDCDAWVAVFDNNNHLVRTVYFGDKNYAEGSTTYIHHNGDNLTGEGDGDDEVIEVYLANLPSSIKRVSIGVTIYEAISRNQNFDMIENLFVRVVDTRDNFEICRFDNKATSEFPGSLTFIVGDLVRGDNGWEFEAVGKGNKASSIPAAVRQL